MGRTISVRPAEQPAPTGCVSKGQQQRVATQPARAPALVSDGAVLTKTGDEAGQRKPNDDPHQIREQIQQA